MKRKEEIYRSLRPLAEAREIFLRRFAAMDPPRETIPVREALGRVAARPATALRSVPDFHCAAMDGIAVEASRTFGARPESPVIIPKDDPKVCYVDTGDPLPEWADAVVVIEKVEELPHGWEVREAVYPWQNVRKVGEDIVKGETILPARGRISAFDQAALLAAGVLSVEVFRQPRVLVIPTGDELILPEDAPGPLPRGALVESNGQMVASMVAECGAVATLSRPVPDDIEALRQRIASGLSQGCDMILLLAGSSTGSADFTPSVLGGMGEVLVHGVAIMPGKPAVLAAVGERPVVGIPGYPVSAVVCVREFVQPLLFMMQGLERPRPAKVPVTLARKIPSRLGLEEHVRVVVGTVRDRVVALPLAGGAGRLSSLIRADAIIRIPQEASGLAEGERVDAEMLCSEDRVAHNLLAVGSHDLTLDVLCTVLSERTGGRVRLSSSNVGSLGGLKALKNRTAHVAGSHLLDTETGEYNLSYIRDILEGVPVTVVTLVHRWQGFMVRPGNPKGITGVKDLARPDVVFINRQAGSGTRVLLDYEVRKASIEAAAIAGYRNEEYTHMNVAVAVASGAADVGMGIHAAATALGLDFIPVALERYDLVIPSDLLEDAKIQLLLEIVRSEAFKARVLQMGGYEVGDTGRIVAKVG